MRQGDEDLEKRFADLRAWERPGMPTFAAVVNRHRRRPSRVPLLAAAALIVAAGVVLLPRFRGGPGEAVGIAQWQSPTAWLLAVPGPDLLRHVPSLSESVIHLEEQ